MNSFESKQIAWRKSLIELMIKNGGWNTNLVNTVKEIELYVFPKGIDNKDYCANNDFDKLEN